MSQDSNKNSNPKKRLEPSSLFSSVLISKKQKQNISSQNELLKLAHGDVLDILRVDLFFSKNEIKKVEKQIEGDDYPSNALNGRHLYCAIDAYNDEYSRQQDRVTAKQAMITSLMDESKINTKSIADAIASWLVEQFITVNGSTPVIAQILPSEFADDPYLWLDKQLKTNLKKCFEERLDKPYILENIKDNISGFYNRESFVIRAQKMVEENVKHFFNNKDRTANRHTDFCYGIVANGSGNGKTRACREFQNVILQMPISHQSTIFRKLHCYFPLNNGYSLNAVETTNPIQDATDGKIVGLRMLCSIYGKSVSVVTDELGSYFDLIYKDTTLFNMAKVVQKLGTFLNDNEVLLLSIAIDEIQVLMDYFENSKWKQPVYCIGRYMVNTTTPNGNLHDNICLIPIISGVATDDRMQFKSTEYGNFFFSLPPLSALDMKKIIPDYFKNWKFKCGALLLKAFTINDKETVRNLSTKIIEGLLVPNVLRLTLREICSTLECHTLQEWDSNSLTIFSTIQQNIEQAILNYLPKYIGERSTLTKILSCQSIDLNTNPLEKKQFELGRIYLTSTKVLYLPTTYFHQLLQTNDNFIYGRLPRIISDISSRNFEQIDLKCICKRLDYFESLKQNSISLEQLFPGSVCGTPSELCFDLPYTTDEFKLKYHESFIVPVKMKTNQTLKQGNNVEYEELENYQSEILDETDERKIIFNVKANECKVEPFTIYTYFKTNHPAVDGHFCLNDSCEISSIFLIQYRHYGLKSNLSPVAWLEKGDFANRAVESFKNKNMSVYFVFITTTTISPNELEKLRHHEYYKQFILIYHTKENSPAVRYFPPNLLPYYMMFLFDMNSIPLETDIQQYSQEQDKKDEYFSLGELVKAIPSERK